MNIDIKVISIGPLLWHPVSIDLWREITIQFYDCSVMMMNYKDSPLKRSVIEQEIGHQIMSQLLNVNQEKENNKNEDLSTHKANS
jgi:hypothetical protein